MANANNLSSMVLPGHASASASSDEEVVTTIQSAIRDDCDSGEGFVPTLRMQPPTGAPKRKKKRPRSPEEPKFSEDQLDNPEFSDEENVNYDSPPKDGTLMLKPARSITLAKVSREVKERMKRTISTEITNQIAKKELGLTPQRWKHVTDTKPVGSLRLSDSLGYIHLFWPTSPLSEQLLSHKRSLALMKEVSGAIRDQGEHLMCCFFALCDLISSTAVLHGQMDSYKPLSQMYICQNVDEKEYAKKTTNGHNCYLSDFHSALQFAKESKGIPLATEAELTDTFDCGVKRVIEAAEKRYRIKEVYKYETLQQALVRLKTHTVAATLLCYEGWEDPGLYTGPGENAHMVGEHEVIMLACVKYEGKIAIQCKSSNGEHVGNDGYLYVSTDVMFIEVASSRKENRQATCRIKPSYLLYDFYSIDMDDGPCGVKFATKLFKKQENMNFRVKFQDPHSRRRGRGISSLQVAGRYIKPNCGVVLEPFEEMKKELDLVPSSPQHSLARHLYSPECEAAVNAQINVEYNVSYVYHALYAYFDRDNSALKGLAKFFKDSSVEERDHAEMLMGYQNKRGGRVKLQPMVMPQSEFDHAEKGDALYAMELALSLEKLVNEKLLNVHSVASKNDDVQLADFIESEFLNEQVEAIKKISECVAQLRRLGKGHGTWHFDQELLEAAAA